MPKCTKSNSKGAAGMTLIANTEREHMLWCFSLKVWILDSYGGSIQSQKSKLYHDGIHIYIYQLIMYIYTYICILIVFILHNNLKDQQTQTQQEHVYIYSSYIIIYNYII
jgi:hypothetical protein